ncbi:hypothetical protein NXX09_19755 [Bacteroides uniformis]|nr:hypothetical protein [Bacteroides uniformis]
MTLNGFVPARNDSLLQWIQNSDDGFPSRRGRSTRMLYPGYPLVDLICDKEQSAPSDIYLAEIYDDSGAELLRGLSLYRLIDEMVIFLLPVISSETVPVSKHISTDKWGTGQDKNIQKRDLPPYLSQNIAIKDCTLLHLQYFHQSRFYGADFLFLYYSATCHVFMWQYAPLVHVFGLYHNETCCATRCKKWNYYTKNRIHYDTDRQGDIPDDAPPDNGTV